jgi:hypothetical protein
MLIEEILEKFNKKDVKELKKELLELHLGENSNSILNELVSMYLKEYENEKGTEKILSVKYEKICQNKKGTFKEEPSDYTIGGVIRISEKRNEG